jgi:ankyrin repeat protein
LSPKRINLIKYQGKSAIDAAATNGHTHVVQYLLNYDYFRRPLIDPKKERQEQLTNFLISSLLDPDGRYIERNLNDCINFQPNFESVREHTTVDHAQASQFLMQITNASPIVRPFISLAVTRQCVNNLTQIIDHTYRKYANQDCSVLKKLYDAFRDHNKVEEN